MKKIKINLLLGFFICLFIVLSGISCSTVDAFKNRYEENVKDIKGDYNLFEDMRQVGAGLRKDIRAILPPKPLIKALDFLGKGFEKVGL